MGRSPKRRAFTLVELLVVIAIIGLLSTVAMVATSGARVKARNAKRLADIKQLSTAFQLGRDVSSSGTFPSSGGNVYVCVSASCYDGWSGYGISSTVDDFIKPYISPKPSDPQDSSARGYGGYLYNGAWVGGNFGSYGIFAPGTILDVLLEPGSTCGSGRQAGGTANYVDCIFYLN